MRSPLLAWRVLWLLIAQAVLMEGVTSMVLGGGQLRGVGTDEVLTGSHALAGTSGAGTSQRTNSSRQLSSTSGGANIKACKSNPGHCTIYTFSNAGFGNDMNGLLLAIACYGKYDIVVDMKLSPYQCGAGLESLFTLDINPTHSELSNEKCQKVEYINGHKALQYEDADIVFHLLGAAALRVWRFTPEMQSLTDKMTDFMHMVHGSHPTDSGSHHAATLAVHVRGGDKVQESSVNSADWYSKNSNRIIKAATKLIAEPDVITTCIVFGDDLLAGSHVLMALAKQFKCAGVQVGGTFAGHKQSDFNAASNESRCHETKKMLAEIHAMSSADYFLGSFASNVPRLVHVLRASVYGKDANTSGDISDSLNWGHHWRARQRKKPAVFR